MLITRADIIQINTSIDVSSIKGKKKFPWRPVIVKLYTDEGIYGLGEAALAYGAGTNAGVGILKDFLPKIIGMDPFCTEAIFNKLQNKTFWGKGGGTVISAGLSAIDMACYDIQGKALGQPLYKLLGGKCRETLRVYASQIQSGWGKDRRALTRPEEYRDAALKAVEDGYDAVKVDLFQYDYEANMSAFNLCTCLPKDFLQMIEARICAVRKAVGSSVDIIVENHAATDVGTVVEMAKVLEPYSIMFLEEPNNPQNANIARQIKEKVNIPLASGERLYTRWGFAQQIIDRSLDVIQPDLGTCGGITEGKKIADMAYAYDIQVQAHACGSPIVKAATLHFEASLPNFIIHEHHRNSLTDANIELGIYDYQPVNGKYSIPELPGIGQDLSEKAYQLADITSING